MRIGTLRRSARYPRSLTQTLRDRIDHLEQTRATQTEMIRQLRKEAVADASYQKLLEKKLAEAERLLAMSEVLYEDQMDAEQDTDNYRGMAVREIRKRLRKADKKCTRGQKQTKREKEALEYAAKLGQDIEYLLDTETSIGLSER